MNLPIEVERVLEINIFLLTNLLDEGDKLIKSRSLIILIIAKICGHLPL